MIFTGSQFKHFVGVDLAQICRLAAGSSFRKHRKTRRITRDELARRIGVSESTVGRFERGLEIKHDLNLERKLKWALTSIVVERAIAQG